MNNLLNGKTVYVDVEIALDNKVLYLYYKFVDSEEVHKIVNPLPKDVEPLLRCDIIFSSPYTRQAIFLIHAGYPAKQLYTVFH